jgi:hypothetical protein
MEVEIFVGVPREIDGNFHRHVYTWAFAVTDPIQGASCGAGNVLPRLCAN